MSDDEPNDTGVNRDADGLNVKFAVELPAKAEHDVASCKSWPVVARFPSVEALMAVLGRRDADPGPLINALICGVGEALTAATKHTHTAHDEAAAGELPDDAFVHQDNERLPDRDLYLRLARQGAFPSSKQGKKIVARWGDVKSVLVGSSPTVAKASARPIGDEDDLDDARRLMGLKGKAG
jgi:hypothetical protein